MCTNLLQGKNCVIGNNISFGNNVTICDNCIIENNVVLNDNVYIDSNTIVRSNVELGKGTYIGSNSIIGEYLSDFYIDRKNKLHPLIIGENCLIRSGTIIYGDTTIGDGFQTGHRVTIREKAHIGNNVSIGTLSDIQGNCEIGNHVRIHSSVFVAPLSIIDDFVWIYPHVVLTNDPTPPSEHFVGVHVKRFAIVASGSIIMPGLEIGEDTLIAAGTIVTKPVSPYSVVAGNPGKVISDVRKIKSKITGENVYPWRHHFKNYMPWSECDFSTWYAALDIEGKVKFKIETLTEEKLED